MRISQCLRWLLLVPFAVLPGIALSETPEEAAFSKTVLPLVKKYCFECHRGNEPQGDLRLDDIDRATHVADHPDLWGRIAKKLSKHEMPPDDSLQPSAEEAAAITDWIDSRLKQLADAEQPNPGRVTMRRLNREEYNNTIRDLVGVDFQPADDFPVDDTGYGFDNIGDVLSVSPVLAEKYLSAAEQIIDRAIVEQETGDIIANFEGRSLRRVGNALGDSSGTSTNLWTNGEVEADLDIPDGGRFHICVKAHGQQAGSDPVRMSVRVDGKEIKLVDVPAEQNAPGEYMVPWRLEAGQHRIGLAFVNDYYDPKASNPNNRDRNLVVMELQVRDAGETAWEKLPKSHQRIIGRMPSPGNRSQLAKEVIRGFGRRAFRRPVDGDELKRLFRLYQLAERDGAKFEQAIKLPLQAILVSPNFLYRVEIDRSEQPSDGPRELSPYEIASRLSYFLWSSMPDDALFNAAGFHDLTADGMPGQVTRMLDDRKSKAFVENFAGQWLQLRKLNITTPDADRFPQFTAELREDMRRETELFFEAVLREDRPITDLIDADFTFVNERLAKLYGMKDVQGSEFRRVSVARETRGGLLTQASILTLTSNPTRTSPVKRGKWVLENLLGAPPPAPPADVPELPDEKQGQLVGTLRERLEQHRSDSKCSVCHNHIDPLGFGLENYDAIGAWRTRDGEGAVDATGSLPDGKSFKGPAELKQLLVSRRDELTHALGEKMLTYAIGRGLTHADRNAVDKIVTQTVENNYKLKSLVLAVIESDPFRKTMAGGTP